ncbi:MAG: hypothetical protein S4CHLAM37_14110 [Chlamydiia bacterium]|nr:hypothetical protein [Chlamydiia bacterium]
MSFPYGYYQPYYQQAPQQSYSAYAVSNVTPIVPSVSYNPTVSSLMHELTNSSSFMRVAPRGALSGRVHVEPSGIYMERAYQPKTMIYSYGSFDPYLDAQIFKICELTAPKPKEEVYLEMPFSFTASPQETPYIGQESSFNPDKPYLEVPFSFTHEATAPPSYDELYGPESQDPEATFVEMSFSFKIT